MGNTMDKIGVPIIVGGWPLIGELTMTDAVAEPVALLEAARVAEPAELAAFGGQVQTWGGTAEAVQDFLVALIAVVETIAAGDELVDEQRFCLNRAFEAAAMAAQPRLLWVFEAGPLVEIWHHDEGDHYYRTLWVGVLLPLLEALAEDRIGCCGECGKIMRKTCAGHHSCSGRCRMRACRSRRNQRDS